MTSPARKVPLRLVWGADHYEDVVRAIREAKVSVWIATANMKDVHVEAPIGTRARARGRFTSLFDELGSLVQRGVEVRILHAGDPSRPLRARMGSKSSPVSLKKCIRVHMKMIAVDGALLYLGSANFTGAGLGAKSEGKRNFEAGILTSDDVLLDRMQGEFDTIWSGGACKTCKLRGECPAPLDAPPRSVRRATSGSTRSGSAAPAGAVAASPSRGVVRAGRRKT